MTVVELKSILKQKIARIDDVAFLNAIKIILDSKSDNEVLSLSKKQRNEIIASKREIELGLFVDHKELDKEVKSWLNEK
jgi:predicted transcriptional regulator